jgi:rubrerythrin
MQMLADVEVKHYQVLKNMKESLDLAVQIEMDADNYRGVFKTMFTDLNEQVSSFEFQISQAEMYRTARQREDEAHRFYVEQAAESEEAEAKALFETLAAQEQLHFDILESIIEFVSRPESGQWLENAEWYHSDEY